MNISRVSLVVLCLSLSAHLVSQQPSRGEQALASKDWFTAENFFRDSVRVDLPRRSAAAGKLVQDRAAGIDLAAGRRAAIEPRLHCVPQRLLII